LWALAPEIGDFRPFGHPRELPLRAGITPSVYSSGDQQHRGHITKAGNRRARRLLVQTAWNYHDRPWRPTSGPRPSDRACQAQVRLHRRYHDLVERGRRSTVANVAVACERRLSLARNDQRQRQEAAA
jgi:transposase